MIDYECCICKETVSSGRESSTLDPCALVVVSNIDQPRESQKEQQFFCHFECFRKLVNRDGVLYIMDSDFPTIGELAAEEETPPEDDARA
jgi:hypothetical protein